MVELIERRHPAVMLCHWPGMYSQGTKEGFLAFQRIVNSLEQHYGDQTMWMKLSEIGRYYAAKRFTKIARDGNRVTFEAPFGTPRFTFKIPAARGPVQSTGPLREVTSITALDSESWIAEGEDLIVCIDLPKGASQLRLG